MECRIKLFSPPPHCPDSSAYVLTLWNKAHTKSGYYPSPPLVFSAYFLIEPRTTGPGMAPPTMCWNLLYHSLIKKMPYNCVLWRHFLNQSFLLSDNCRLS